MELERRPTQLKNFSYRETVGDDVQLVQRLALHLRSQREAILLKWEERVRAEVPSARLEESVPLRDHLPLLLEKLERLLLNEAPTDRQVQATAEVSHEHGVQRSHQDYDLKDVLKEYQILRQTLFEEFDAIGSLPSHIRDVVLDVVQQASHQATETFVRKQQFRAMASWSTRRKSGPLPYLTTVLIIAMATALQLALWPVMKPAPYILYYPAIIVCALVARGWFAVLLSAFAAQYFFNNIEFDFSMAWPVDHVRNLVYLVSSGAIVWLASLFRRAQRRAHIERERSLAFAEQQNALADLGRLSFGENEEFLHQALRTVSQVLRSDTAKIVEYIARDRLLVVRAQHGFITQEEDRSWLATSESQIGYTLKVEAPVVVRDYKTETRFIWPESLRLNQLQSGISVLIPGEKEPFGVLVLYSRKVREFTDDEKAFVLTAAGTLANVIKRRQAEILIHQNQAQLRQLNAELAEANSKLSGDAVELNRSNAELSRFAAIAAHDLKAPLNSISQFTELIQYEYGSSFDTDANEYFGFITRAADRLRKLIDRLLSYSRVGARSEPFRTLDFNHVLESAKQNLSASIAAADAVITSDLLPSVSGDETELVQLFQNLLGNAIKFHGSDAPVIHISLSEVKDCWQFSVADNGIGIDPKDAVTIFEPFKRLRESEYEGTGLGLAIVYKIVHHHGGTIWMRSTPGHGSTFCFTLPKVRSN